MYEPYFGTRENPVKIDESYFSGNRKYNKGRILHGGRQVVEELDDSDTDEQEIPDWALQNGSYSEHEKFERDEKSGDR